MKKIGLIGLGIMGVPMASNWLKTDWPVTVYNRTPGKADDLEELGALVAATPAAAAAASDYVVVMVSDEPAVEAVLFGPNGVAGALTPGKVVVNMSTVSPEFSRRVAARIEATGGEFIDAPVSGSKKPAVEGTLIILAGGKPEVVRASEPFFGPVSKKLVHCGPAGAGSMMKMAVNLFLAVVCEGFGEALRYGQKGGLEMKTMLEVILNGPLASPFIQMKAPLMESGDFAPQFPLKHMTKDMMHVVETAYRLRAVTPLAHAALAVHTAGMALGHGEEDVSVLAKVLQEMGG